MATVPDEVWQAEGGFDLVPPEAADTSFRELTRRGGANSTYNKEYRIRLQAVGTFDAEAIDGFSDLSGASLTTYALPRLSCGDPRSCELLNGKDLLPNGSPAGYLQQPPLMLTTLDAIPAFYNGYYRRTDAGPDKTAGAAPISAIRVRVAGVNGVDPVSRERVRVAAEEIARRTGLDVDITMGSSLSRQAITLPAGQFGRPELSLVELWTAKGVAAVIATAVDRKSLLLFILVLVVCAMFVSNASASAVRTRRTELGVLACLGWTRRALFGIVLGELLLIGTAAGTLGAGIAKLAGGHLGIELTWQRAFLAVPAAIALTMAAGLMPAWAAARVDPMAAIHPPVSAGRRATLRLGITSLALANVRRRPGRSALGASALASARPRSPPCSRCSNTSTAPWSARCSAKPSRCGSAAWTSPPWSPC